MSFLPDLAGWALSGGADRNDENENSNDGTDNNDTNEPMQQESEEEIRAKRLARLAARFDKNEESNDDTDSKKPAAVAAVTAATAVKDNGPSPMKVDSPAGTGPGDEDIEMKPATTAAEEPKKADPSPTKKSASTASPDTSSEPLPKKKRGKEPLSKLNPINKTQRKKEMLIKKILNIKLTGGKVISSDCIEIDIGSTNISEANIAEILALRLALPSSALQSVSPKDRNLISYLASCHKKAAEELKNSKSSSSKSFSDSSAENEKLLNEIKNQVVSFAASSLMEPDLFVMGKDGIANLTGCLTSASLDPSNSITIGVSGKNSSFYACLCEELFNQDQSTFETVIKGAALNICESLKKCETILDSSDGSGLVLVSALTAMCTSKKAAVVLTKIQNFLLPKADTTEANEKISMPPPPPPANATPQQQSLYRMMIAMSGGGQKYLRRSGPGLEKETLLGLVMRLGTPMDNSAISSQFQNPARRNRIDVKKTTDNLRRQLKGYQDTVYSFVKALITSGEEARKPVRPLCFLICYLSCKHSNI